jgi:O-antigen/teichoic acid export membrane protein
MPEIATTAQPADESVFKPALLLMCGRTLALAATFFIPIALVRIFTPAQFGTYKQLFLVFSTVYLIAQLGMATSLYYFIPQTPRAAGRYAANSFVFLGIAGFVCLAGLLAGGPKIAQWLSNPELAQYLPWIGAYVLFMMMSAALEIVLISRRRYFLASATYAISDLARAAALTLPVLLFRSMNGLVIGAVAVAFLRAIATFFYFRREFRGDFVTDRALLRKQLAYALPFSAAVLIEILQASIPQYVVSWLYDPATFAVFAVGCLQIPLVDVAAGPTSDVMMVKMQERLAEGRKRAVLDIWLHTTEKLSLLFFPLSVFAVVSAREIVTLLYTQKYLASVPVFAVWSTLILLSALQVDGVMRVFAQTRFLLGLNVMRFLIIAGLIRWSLAAFHLTGPVIVVLLAMVMFKLVALLRMRKLLEIPLGELMPWRNLTAILGAAGCAGAAAMAVESQMHAATAVILLAMGLAFTAMYAALVWSFSLIGHEEKAAIVRTLAFGKG